MVSPEQQERHVPQTGCTDPAVEIIIEHDTNWYARDAEPEGTAHNPHPSPAVTRQWQVLGFIE